MKTTKINATIAEELPTIVKIDRKGVNKDKNHQDEAIHAFHKNERRQNGKRQRIERRNNDIASD